MFRRAVLVIVALAATAVFAVAAPAATARVVVGQGSTSQFRCPTGVTVPAQIQFNAQKNRGSVFGSYFIFGAGVSKFGQVTSGNITPNSYSLNGITTQEFCANVPLNVPVNATLSGDCGRGVIIHYQDATGERGDFLGDVACD